MKNQLLNEYIDSYCEDLLERIEKEKEEVNWKEEFPKALKAIIPEVLKSDILKSINILTADPN